MPLTHEPHGRGPYAATSPNAWKNLTVEDIPPGWIDEMVRRLLEEWNRQMLKLENASKKAPGDQDIPRLREQNAAVLAKHRRELKEILKMEDERAVKRFARSTQEQSDAIEALERRLDQLLERERAAGRPVESEPERGEEIS